MCNVADKPAADDPQSVLGKAVRVDSLRHLGPRRRKETLLPEIAQLALEGHTGQAIGCKLGLPKRTVNHWLREVRKEWTAKAAECAGEMFSLELARLESIYREAMQAWRDSQSETEARFTEEIEVAGQEPKKKISVRSQRQRGNAALLARATAAVLASCRLKGRVAPSPAPAAEGDDYPDDDLDEPIPSEPLAVGSVQIPEAGTIEADKWWLEMLEEEDLQVMSFDEVREAGWRLRRVLEAEGRPFPAELEKQDLEHMTDEELRAHRARLMAAIEAFDPDAELPPAPESIAPHALPEQD